jgi:GntR family transcriptional regulator / MocR family aminotransferase
MSTKMGEIYMHFDFDLKRRQGEPLYRSIANQLLSLINCGELPVGYQLPTTRDMANSLGLSRDVIIQSYGELLALGVIEVRSTNGTFVGGRNVPKPQESAPSVIGEPAGFLSEYCKRLTEESNLHATSGYLSTLNFGAAPSNLLPNRAWHQLLIKHCKIHTHIAYKPDVLGRIELRKAIQSYLKKNKGIECAIEQIVIWSQSQNAINALFRVLLNPGDNVVIEDPGFGGIRDICMAQGVNLLPIPIDEYGLQTELLAEVGESSKLAYVTPTHHDPTGIALAKNRRSQLLDWAKSQRAWIIEDDYDGFLAYDKRDSAPLLSLDRDGHVIYISSFWKFLYPLTPVGFAVVPKTLIDVVVKTKLLSEPNSYALEHLALAEYLMSGRFSNHVRKVQKTYAERRRALLYQLYQCFGDTISIARQSAGSHHLVNMGFQFDDEQVLKCGLTAGLGISSTKRYYLTKFRPGEFIIDFSCLPADDCEAVVSKFHKLLQIS